MISPFVEMLGSYFLKTVEISLHASLIIGVLLVIRPVIKRVLPPRWVYALWFIVVARLLLVEVPSLPASAASAPLQSSLALVQSINLEDFPPHAGLYSDALSAPETVAPDASIRSPGAPAASAMTWPETLAVIWLAGVAALLFRFGLGSFRWSRRLAKAPMIEAPEICRILEECREEMGVRPVRLVQLDGFASPSMTGPFYPTIILPKDFLERFSPEELRWILLHELAHLKRWDLPVQMLCQVLQAVHWFNPLVWLAFAFFRCDREVACDAHVLDHQAPKTTRDYGHALIKVAETYPRSFLSPGFLGISEDKTDLKERVEKIGRHRRPALGWITAGVILCTLLAVVFLTRQAAPVHRATAKIQISGNYWAPAEIEVIQSSDVVVPAIKSLGLEKTWAKRFGSNESAWTDNEIMDYVSKILKVEVVAQPSDGKGIGVVYVTVEGYPPQESADIANRIVENYKNMKDAETRESLRNSIEARDGDAYDDAKVGLAAKEDNLQRLYQRGFAPNNPATLEAQSEVDELQKLLNREEAENADKIEREIDTSDSGVRILARAY